MPPNSTWFPKPSMTISAPTTSGGISVASLEARCLCYGLRVSVAAFEVAHSILLEIVPQVQRQDGLRVLLLLLNNIGVPERI
jgi:hypothetical protein